MTETLEMLEKKKIPDWKNPKQMFRELKLDPCGCANVIESNNANNVFLLECDTWARR